MAKPQKHIENKLRLLGEELKKGAAPRLSVPVALFATNEKLEKHFKHHWLLTLL